MKKNIIVTGGAGFVGSHACKELYKSEFNPIVIDNLSNGFKHNVKWGPLEICDIKDEKKLIKVFNKYNPIAVIHFAANAYVGESMENPIKYYDNNIVGTLSLLKVMSNFNIKNIIFSSSCATYGIPKYLPIDLKHPQDPVNPYGFSKLVCENMIKQIATSCGFKYCILRYFNAAGNDPECELIEEHEPETHLIPLAIRSAYEKNFKLRVFGNDYDTRDGTCIRDFVHVSHLAKAHVYTLKDLLNNQKSIIKNLGSGKGYTIKEVIQKIELYSNKKIKIIVEKRRCGDPKELWTTPDLTLKKFIKDDPLNLIIQTAIDGYKKKNNIC